MKTLRECLGITEPIEVEIELGGDRWSDFETAVLNPDEDAEAFNLDLIREAEMHCMDYMDHYANPEDEDYEEIEAEELSFCYYSFKLNGRVYNDNNLFYGGEVDEYPEF